jgi:hypothetical protein
MVLRHKPSNHSASSVLHTRSPPSEACHLHGQHGHSHVFSHLSMSQVSATAASHPASGSLGPSLTSVLHPSGPSARHVLLDLHLAVATASVLHTCTTQAKRHVAHKAFTKAGLVTTQPTSWITLTITHHKTNTQGYLSTLCSHNGRMVLHQLPHCVRGATSAWGRGETAVPNLNDANSWNLFFFLDDTDIRTEGV